MLKEKIEGNIEDFIANLIEAAKTYGWSGDYGEIESFVRSTVYELTDKEIPYNSDELDPY